MSGSTPNRLPAIAHDARIQAQALRAVSIRTSIVSATTQWESAGAARFRERVLDAALALRRAADRLDDAADRIDQYAVRLDGAAR